MSQPFIVDSATLHQAAKDVHGTRQDVQARLSALRAEAQRLTSGAQGWAGGAAADFSKLFTLYDDCQTKVLGRLGDIADLLDRAGTQHSSTDEQQRQEVSRIISTLEG